MTKKTKKRYAHQQAADALQELLDFIQTPKSEKQWRRIDYGRALLKHLVEAEPIDATPVFNLLLEDLERESPKALLSYWQDIESWVCAAAAKQWQPEPRTMYVELSVFPACPTAKLMSFIFTGGTKDLLWVQITRLLEFIGPERVTNCGCGRLFVRAGKRRFCSTRCQSREYMRRYRSGEVGEN